MHVAELKVTHDLHRFFVKPFGEIRSEGGRKCFSAGLAYTHSCEVQAVKYLWHVLAKMCMLLWGQGFRVSFQLLRLQRIAEYCRDELRHIFCLVSVLRVLPVLPVTCWHALRLSTRGRLLVVGAKVDRRGLVTTDGKPLACRLHCMYR